MDRQPRHAGAALAALSVALIAAAPPAPTAPVAPVAPLAPPPALLTANAAPQAVDGSFPVAITLSASLAGLDPQAVNGAWFCSARALSKPAIDAEIAKISRLSGAAARAEFASFLEYRAHYLGQQASVAFPIAGGAGASQSISIKVGRDDLVDPASKRLIDQPAVMVGCWLQLTNAAGLGGFALQGPKPAATGTPGAMLQVPAAPYFLTSASVPNA